MRSRRGPLPVAVLAALAAACGGSGPEKTDGNLIQLDGPVQNDGPPAQQDATTSDSGGGTCTSVADLLSQAGCEAAQACDVLDANGNIGCRTAGSVGYYQPCTYLEDCGKGADCARPSGGTFACAPFCTAQTGTCPGGGVCTLILSTVAGDVGLCTLPESCDLMAGTPCQGVQGCYLADQQGATSCLPAGAVAAGGACTYSNDCVPGYACVGDVCRKWCKGNSDCTNPLTCQGIGTTAPNHADLGVCR